MKNKKLLKSIGVFILCTMIFYLMFSFVIWELNPKNWYAGVRGFFLFFVWVSAIIAEIDYKYLNK